MSEIDDLAADLAETGAKAGKRLRGIMAKHLDVAAAKAKADALSSWTKYGRGAAGSAGTIRARMSSSIGSRGGDRQVGYLLADGDGAFQAEHGKHDRAPDPVMGQAMASVQSALDADLTEQIADLL